MIISEAYLLVFQNLRAIVAESEEKTSKILIILLFLQHLTAYTDTNFQHLKINSF